MTTRIYKIVMTPEDTDDRVAYMIDRTDEPPITEENAGDAFDIVLSANEGYELNSFEEIAECDIPADADAYEVG
ncbi:hypothetical protein ACWEF6_02845 [Amycolatopsis sp. NPDC004772]